MPTTWDWTYDGSDLRADVAYDLFTSSSADGDKEYEIMIWLAKLGDVGPISAEYVRHIRSCRIKSITDDGCTGC